MKKRILIPAAALIILAAAALWFFGFSQIGYFATLGHRGYAQIADRIYLDREYPDPAETVLGYLQDALARTDAFWDGLDSRPVIVVTANQEKLARMGNSGKTALTRTYVLFGAHSFLVVSPAGLNVDVLAHELTHGELHARLYAGKPFYRTMVPIWFDEGLAMQNDQRPQYNENALAELSQGKQVRLSEIEDAAGFFDEDAQTRHFHYAAAKHEVAQWIKANGTQGLKTLVSEVNKGRKFKELYMCE